jgi:hypothetical protein
MDVNSWHTLLHKLFGVNRTHTVKKANSPTFSAAKISRFTVAIDLTIGLPFTIVAGKGFRVCLVSWESLHFDDLLSSSGKRSKRKKTCITNSVQSSSSFITAVFTPDVTFDGGASAYYFQKPIARLLRLKS